MEYSGDYVGYRDLELESLDRCRMEGLDELTHSCLSCVSFAFFRLGQWKQSSEAIGQVGDTHGVDGKLLAVATTVKACMALLKGQRKEGATAERDAAFVQRSDSRASRFKRALCSRVVRGHGDGRHRRGR